MVKSGLDALNKQLRGQRVGQVTNQTGLNREFKRTAAVREEAGAKVAALFGPEHGYYGVEQATIPVAEVVKDRWSGELVEGPSVEPEYRSFVGRYPGLPVRHGLTPANWLTLSTNNCWEVGPGSKS